MSYQELKKLSKYAKGKREIPKFYKIHNILLNEPSITHAIYSEKECENFRVAWKYNLMPHDIHYW